MFLHNKTRAQQVKLNTMKSIAASMAHELRIPLRAISASLDGIKKTLPKLIQTYKIAKKGELAIPHFHKGECSSLPELFEIATSETKLSFNIIDILLVKADIFCKDLTICSMQQCIKETLNRYAFDTGDIDLINCRITDFMFRGNQLLMVHVFFNLIKNALYYVKVAGQGRIYIWSDDEKSANKVHFKDTGKGIAKKDLPHVFDNFFSKTTHGTGVGLAFCKMTMERFGGKIVCRSVENEFVEFILFFPKIKTMEKTGV